MEQEQTRPGITLIRDDLGPGTSWIWNKLDQEYTGPGMPCKLRNDRCQTTAKMFHNIDKLQGDKNLGFSRSKMKNKSDQNSLGLHTYQKDLKDPKCADMCLISGLHLTTYRNFQMR